MTTPDGEQGFSDEQPFSDLSAAQAVVDERWREETQGSDEAAPDAGADEADEAAPDAGADEADEADEAAPDAGADEADEADEAAPDAGADEADEAARKKNSTQPRR